ncbi:MAG: NADPH-dependent F420 reductase, partial [Cytophagales bacterium]
MNIAIIGSGNVGSALAQGLFKAGHTIFFGVRDATSAKAEKASGLVSNTKIVSVAEASKQAEVIIVTTPPEAVLNLAAQLGDVSNKILVDATNSIRTRPEPYPTAFHALKALTKSDKVVKCFN